jgi:hypothetical protein
MTSQALIELQITTQAFLAAQLLTLQTTKLQFPAAPVLSAGGLDFAIDHVEFGQSTLLNSTRVPKQVFYTESFYGLISQDVNATRPQISQPVTVVVVSLQDVEANPNGSPQHPIRLNATMLLGLDYNATSVDSEGVPQGALSIMVDSVVLAPPPALPVGVDLTAVQSLLTGFLTSIGGQSLPLNLAGSALKGRVNIINTGMAVSADMQRLAFRQELGEGMEGDPAIWQTFYSGAFDDRLLDSSGADAAMGVFESAPLLEDVLSSTISEGLSESEQKHAGDSVQFHLVTGVSTTYAVNSGVPTLTTQFSGNLDTSLCSAFTQVTVVSALSVNHPNVITSDTNFSWNTDTTACTVVAGALGSVLGLAVNIVFPGASLVFDPIFFAVAGMAAVMVAKNVVTPSLPTSSGCTSVSDTHMVCNNGLSVSNSPLGKLSLNSLEAQDDGISILSDFGPIPVGAPVIAISQDANFAWQPPSISCGRISGNEATDFLRDPQAYVSLGATASVTAQTLAPISLISATVINDPLNVFGPNLAVVGSQAPIQISLSLGYPGDKYFANPYPCEILVQTTGGVRLIEIPPPPALNQEIIEGLAAVIAGEMLFCQKLVDQWWNTFHRYNPQWSVDPWIGDSAVEHGYEVEISGLQPGEKATLVGAGNQVLQTGIASTGTSLRLSAVVTPAGTNEIGILRGEAGATGAQQVQAVGAENVELAVIPSKRGIAVKEQLIVQVAVIRLIEPVESVAAAYIQGSPHAIVVTGNGVLAFDLANPEVPVNRALWTVLGVRGVLAQGQSLLAYGDDGMAWLDGSGVNAQDCDCGCAEQPVFYSMVAARGHLYAATSRGLEVFSPRLRRRTVIPLDGACCVAQTGNTLVVGGKSGLTMFHLNDPSQPERGKHHSAANVANLVVPPGSSSRELLVVFDRGASQLLDFSAHGQPRLAGTLPVVPWYVGSARIQNFLLRRGPDKYSVSVTYLGKSTLA